MNFSSKLLWLLLVSFAFSFSSCKKDDSETALLGNWVHMTAYGGVQRFGATAATLGDLGYVGTGYNSTWQAFLNDFWSYNAETDTWHQIASFPGSARSDAVSFAAAGKLYVGSGIDADSTYLKDFYEYDPSTNKWSQIDDLNRDNPNYPDVLGRAGMVAFSINNMGYVLGGIDADGTQYKDLYAYDPATKKWTQKADFPHAKRSYAVAFVIDNIAYVCCGTSNGAYPDDFYCYNPVSDTWTRLHDISDKTDERFDDSYLNINRSNAVAFVSGGKAYIATGHKSELINEVWEYNPLTDLWEQKTAFEGAMRTGAVAFTINDKGYVLTGRQNSVCFDDMWRFDPAAEYNPLD